MSDLHLEYDAKAEKPSLFYSHPPQPNADILVLAGDIHAGPVAFDWVQKHFKIPTVLILGNHEPYGRELFRTIAFNRSKSESVESTIRFLERAVFIVTPGTGRPVRFIGATLWTDFALYGTPTLSMELAGQRLDDFSQIGLERGYRQRKLRPADTIRLHRQTVAFLHGQLRRPFDGRTIIVTHHAPSPKSVSPTYRNDPLSPAFASNLDSFIRTYEPALWIHGHMHESFDYRVGRTRVVCNPRGYFPHELNPAFDPNFVIDIPVD